MNEDIGVTEISPRQQQRHFRGPCNSVDKTIAYVERDGMASLAEAFEGALGSLEVFPVEGDDGYVVRAGVSLLELPPELTKRLLRYPLVPAALVERLTCTVCFEETPNGHSFALASGGS